jgi:ADP-L-glycero-D-manno-heptose 6-epimerase
VILITGGNGFIGSNLLKRLSDHSLLFVDDHDRNDIFDDSFCWNKISKIYHLGAVSSTTESDLSKIYELNIDYSIRLFEKAIEYKIPVVYASSASVYGNSYTYRMNPLNYYALSKATIDYWVIDNVNRFSNVVGCRFFNVYGEGEDHKGNQASPIHIFSTQAETTGVIKVFEGSEDFYRDFVWVEDVIDCMLMNKESGIYDVGTGIPISFMNVAELVAEKYTADIETIPFPIKLKDKYQRYTRSRKHYDKSFISVINWLNS